MVNSVQEKLRNLEEALRRQSNPTKALPMQAYMKNRYTYLGIQKPIRAEIIKPFIKSLTEDTTANPADIALALWELEEREFQYVALDYLAKSNYRKQEEILPVLIQLVRSKSWWDTVDVLATGLIGNWLISRQDSLETLCESWISDSDMWVNRTAIIFQLKYRERTDLAFLSRAILAHASSKEFFHQKAIGWALRHYSRTNPHWVKNFVAQNELAALSKREALRLMK